MIGGRHNKVRWVASNLSSGVYFVQIKTSGVVTKYTMFPDFSWSCSNISNIKDKFKLDKYIILFPFCSPHLTQKKWPYFNQLLS